MPGRNGRQGKPPAFQLYPADFLADERAALMTTTQFGAYALLLMYHWREGSVPADEGRLATLCRMRGRTAAWRSVWAGVLSECFEPHPQEPGRLIQRRMADTLEAIAWDRVQAVESGRLGGLKSAKLRAEIQGCLKGTPTSASASSSASASESEPEQAEGPATPAAVQSQVLGIGSLDLGSVLKPMDRNRLTRHADSRLAPLVTAAIARILVLEASQSTPFDPGAWWGKNHTRMPEARLETLIQLGKRLERGDRPDSPFGYCNDTLREKEANINGSRAEAQSAARRKASGREEPERQENGQPA